MFTLHIQVSSGRTYNAQVQGRPELVMPPISTQLFAEFQHSQFPSQVQIGHRTLELVGAPSVPISHTRSAQAAERTWKRIQTRLPTADCRRMRIHGQFGRLEPRHWHRRSNLGFGQQNGAIA